MRRHPALARFAAPAAFLLAATVLVLLVRAGMDGGDEPAAQTSPPAATTSAGTTEPGATGPGETQTGPEGSTAGAEFYEIRSGDTLAGVAAAHDTTVERLLVLNPEIDPTGLQIGQRIRVK